MPIPYKSKITIIKTKPNLVPVINTTLNNLIHYKNIFKHHTHKSTNDIILLKKSEFDIFYSNKYKYPLLVAEVVNHLTGKTDPNVEPIDRRVIEDTFRQDTTIPEKYQHTLADYRKYMEYGGSMGHNAPAGQHKTNLNIYYETFLLTNITPQEMVFNSGLWVLMENWCKYLGNHNRVRNLRVFTGSIPDSKETVFQTDGKEPVKMNIPYKMFKIVSFEMNDNPGRTYLEIFISDNKPYYVNPNIIKFNLTSFLLPFNSYKWFQNTTGINIQQLLKYYGYRENYRPFRNVVSMEIKLSTALQSLMKKSNWYGYLIYSPTLEILEAMWEKCKIEGEKFDSLKFHEEYYELTKQRLLNDLDNKNSTNFKMYGMPSIKRRSKKYSGSMKKSHIRSMKKSSK